MAACNNSAETFSHCWGLLWHSLFFRSGSGWQIIWSFHNVKHKYLSLSKYKTFDLLQQFLWHCSIVVGGKVPECWCPRIFLLNVSTQQKLPCQAEPQAPDLLNQNLYCNKIPRQFIGTLKFECHCPRSDLRWWQNLSFVFDVFLPKIKCYRDLIGPALTL